MPGPDWDWTLDSLSDGPHQQVSVDVQLLCFCWGCQFFLQMKVMVICQIVWNFLFVMFSLFLGVVSLCKRGKKTAAKLLLQLWRVFFSFGLIWNLSSKFDLVKCLLLVRQDFNENLYATQMEFKFQLLTTLIETCEPKLGAGTVRRDLRVTCPCR